MKYIITSYITHGILLFLSLYAIGCCGFHLLPAWGVSEDYDSINNSFLSIALSYVAGWVIYVLTSVLPRQQREKEVFKLWEHHLEKLYNEMSERIEEVRAFVGIDKDKMEALTIEDCKPLERYTDLPAVVWINKSFLSKGSDKPSGVQDVFSIKKDLNHHYKTVNHVIDTMLDNPAAVNADTKVLDILSQIRASRFLGHCTSIMDSSMLQNPPISICHSELPDSFCEYVMLRDKLGTLPIEKTIFEVRLLTAEEVQKIIEDQQELLAKQGLTMEKVKTYGQQIVKASKKL